MSKIRPLRATLIDSEANGGPGVLPARVRPATLLIAPTAFADTRYSKFKLERESIIRNAPAVSGVYGLFNVFWIYVGETSDLRARLLEHLEADGHPCFGRYRPAGFAFETVAPELRKRRCSQLLEELEPLCNMVESGCPEFVHRMAGDGSR